MTKEAFAPKGADVLRQEITTELGLDPENDVNKEIIEKIVARELKSEEFKASEKNKTAKARELAKNMAKAKEFYKKGGKPKGAKPSNDNKPKGDETDLLVAEKVYLALGGTNTEVRQIKKIMAATGKNFDRAKKDTLFLAWKEKNDEATKDKKAQLGASHGGTPVEKAGAKTEKDKEFLQAMGKKEEKK